MRTGFGPRALGTSGRGEMSLSEQTRAGRGRMEGEHRVGTMHQRLLQSYGGRSGEGEKWVGQMTFRGQSLC